MGRDATPKLRTRLLIADRHPILVEGLAWILAAHGYAVVERANNVTDAVAALSAGDVDLALIDIDLVDPAPLAMLGRRDTTTAMIITVPSAMHPALAAALGSKAEGVVLKTDPPASILHCIGVVAAGGHWRDRDVVVNTGVRTAIDDTAKLTRRERDVATLVATGQRNRKIAGALGITEGTVKMHLHNVYAKLGVESRTQLAMDARMQSLRQL